MTLYGLYCTYHQEEHRRVAVIVYKKELRNIILQIIGSHAKKVLRLKIIVETMCYSNYYYVWANACGYNSTVET